MLQAIVLGLVQGLTEFLPVSSSGHLVVVPYLFSWQQPPLAFDVALHVGTLFAVISYFAGDLWYLATRSIGVGTVEDGEAGRARRTIGLLALGSFPAAIGGLTLEGWFARVFDGPDAPRYVAIFLMITAVILYGAEALKRRRAAAIDPQALADDPALDLGRDESTVGWLDAFVIGCAQALALFPGISRSGSTMAAGMARGLSRQGAARFAFLLSIPIIAGAGLSQASEMMASDASITGYGVPETLVGTLVAAISGYWAIRYLIRLVATDDLTGFARYVAVFGALTFVGTLWIGPISAV